MHSYIKPTDKVREHEINDISEWVYGLAPWSLFFTGTFRGEYTEAAAQRAFERFTKKNYPQLTYFYSLERNPSRVGHHVHVLFSKSEGMYRKQFWNKWFTQYGRNKLEPINSREDVANYCTKHLAGYLTKSGGWWNYRLANPDLWHQNKKANTQQETSGGISNQVRRENPSRSGAENGAKPDSEPVFNPDVYREECPLEGAGQTPWVWCSSCKTIFQFGWYVWEESSFTKYANGGWNNGQCLCPVSGCGSDFGEHRRINADGSCAHTGSDWITVPFEAWDKVDPQASDDFKLVG